MRIPIIRRSRGFYKDSESRAMELKRDQIAEKMWLDSKVILIIILISSV